MYFVAKDSFDYTPLESLCFVFKRSKERVQEWYEHAYTQEKQAELHAKYQHIRASSQASVAWIPALKKESAPEPAVEEVAEIVISEAQKAINYLQKRCMDADLAEKTLIEMSARLTQLEETMKEKDEMIAKLMKERENVQVIAIRGDLNIFDALQKAVGPNQSLQFKELS
jgi:hypothetical protein